jgi:hypothetical protein
MQLDYMWGILDYTLVKFTFKIKWKYILYILKQVSNTYTKLSSLIPKFPENQNLVIEFFVQ